MRIETEPKLDFDDVLIRPKRSTLSGRGEVDINRTFLTKHSNREITGFPVIAANMDTVASFEIAVALSEADMFTAVHKHYSEDDWREFNTSNNKHLPNVFYTSGISRNDLMKLRSVLLTTDVSMICLDVANGYMESFVEAVSEVRSYGSSFVIMAGNVVTADMTEALILAGADIVKLGIGPGSVCTTRKVTGIGYPQLSAVIECADAAHGLGGLVCADGGCRTPGDIVKAFASGADFVMLGGMLAGHDECGGQLTENGTMTFYGMSSEEAMKKHHGEVASHRASEGKSVEIPYRGGVVNTIQEIKGGVRSACSYVGAKTLKQLSKRTTFVRVNKQYNDVYGK